MNDKNIDSHSEYPALKHLKQQTTKLQCAYYDQNVILCIGVDANKVIVIIIALGVNGPL